MLLLDMASAEASASLYGNPMLDAKKGGKGVFERLKDAVNHIYYLDERRQNGTYLSKDDRTAMLLAALRKRLTKKVIDDKIKVSVHDKQEEVHVLGGVRPDNSVEVKR